jgi:hypothetical protein
MMFTFWNSYVLKLLRLETITFGDATLSDINVMLCYVLSQYRIYGCLFQLTERGGGGYGAKSQEGAMCHVRPAWIFFRPSSTTPPNKPVKKRAFYIDIAALYITIS